jgi:polyisoprenoid-binding protein YceI
LNDTVERTVVGRSPGVAGGIELAGPYLAAASFEVDLTQLRSDWDKRDEQMPLVLDTAQFPTATLALLEPVRIPAVLTLGTPVTVDVPATLTLKGVTQPVLLAVTARWNGDTLDVAGGTVIGLADFGIDPGTAGGLVEVGGEATVEFVVRLVRG